MGRRFLLGGGVQGGAGLTAFLGKERIASARARYRIFTLLILTSNRFALLISKLAPLKRTIMTKEEWEVSRSAPDMLTALHLHNPEYFKSLIPVLHRYFLACCWKIKHLIPQKHLQNGVTGAEKWIEGEINDAELYRLNWYAEAECFAIDYAETKDELEEIASLINGIEQLRNLPFEEAKKLLKRAAYFAEISMVYPKINHAPFVKSVCTSQFLCPDLLRERVDPNFT